MTSAEKIRDAIQDVKDEASFIQRLLVDALGWPIADNALRIDDISYKWSAEELRADGLDRVLLEGSVREIVLPDTPWRIFTLEFANPDVFRRGRGTTGILRKVLRGLVLRMRRTKDPKQASFNREDLLFICTHSYQHFTFSYFRSPPEETRTPVIASFGWGPTTRHAVRTLCDYNLKALGWPDHELDERTWVCHWSAAFDVEKVTKHFFDDYSTTFENVEALVRDTNRLDPTDLRLATQALFNRLMFLRFVERKGWLWFPGQEGTNYLAALSAAGPLGQGSLYASRLKPLFFEGLAIQGKQETEAYGKVPFLNGGLFEETDLDKKIEEIPDEAFRRIIGPNGLFYRYNFTIEESTPLDIEVAVDPEMLGKVFEKLVTERNEKGSYYTPRAIVSFMCRETLKNYLGGSEKLVYHHDENGISVKEARSIVSKLSYVKVCDPACGSGAYLVGMLHELHAIIKALDTTQGRATAQLDYQTKLSIISNNLYGVDNDPFATEIARLRLWLTLAVEYEGDVPQPLPNLEFKIETGDSLAGPDPSEMPDLLRKALQKRADSLSTMKDRFLTAHDSEKAALFRSIRAEEQAIKGELDTQNGPGVVDWRIQFAEVFAEGGFDIVIANPPYGIKCDDPLRYQFFPNQQGLPKPSKDSYGLFMARGLELLRAGGQFSYITSYTWRTIRTHRRLRMKLLHETAVHHVLDLPGWVFDATVNTCILTLSKERASAGHTLIAGDLSALARGDWNRLSDNLAAVASHSADGQTTTWARYTYPQSLISNYDNLSFFIGSRRLHSLMSDPRFRPLGGPNGVAEVKAGLQTGDNDYYIRKRPGARGHYEAIDYAKVLTGQELPGLTEEEKQDGVCPDDHEGRHFIPYDKGGESDPSGGWLPNYYIPTDYFIDWSEAAVRRLRTASIADAKRRRGQQHEIRPEDDQTRAAVIRNPQYYFRPGLMFSRTGFYAPTFRIGTSACFDSKSDGVFSDKLPPSLLLGLLNSVLLRYIVKVYLCHSVEAEGDAMLELPLPKMIEPGSDTTRRISELVNSIIKNQKRDPRYPYQLHEQKEIDRLVSELYGLSDEDVGEVQLWFCRRYPRLAEGQGMLEAVKEKYSSHLERCERILSRPAGYWGSHPILQLIAEGESSLLEFKETFEADANTGRKDAGILQSSLKTIAAFLNHEGGTLLIGVTDSGEMKGLSRDYKLCHKHDPDGLELKMRDLLRGRFQPSPLGKVRIIVEPLKEGDVCRVDVQRSEEVVHLDGDVYVRDGNRTLKLTGPDLTRWIEDRAKGQS